MTNIKDISQYITLHSKKNGKKIAIIFEDKKITYAKLEKFISTLSNSFKTMGIKEEDRIAVVLSNCLEFVYILFAAARVGATVVPYNISIPVETMKNNFKYTRINYLVGWHKVITKLYKKKNTEKIIKKRNTIVVGASSKEFISFDRLIKSKQNITSSRNSKNMLNKNYLIALTSGSTGKPKPIVLNQKTKVLRSLYTKKLYKLNNKSIILASTPLYHTLAQRLIILPLILGATSVILSGFSVKKWCEVVKKNKVSFSILVSSQIENLINYNLNIFEKLKSLKTIVSSSATLEKSVKKKIIKLKFPKFFEIYGTSEVAGITNKKINGSFEKMNSVGKGCKYASIKIINDKKEFLKPGREGEIICKTPTIFSGYFNNSYETKKNFYKGYFKTGDIGYLDKENYLYFLSRKKNIIIVGGINVYPEDIENCINSNYKIKKCYAFGIKDNTLGEKIVAAIIPKEKNIKEIDLKNYCLKNLADFQQPHYYYFVDKFPKNSLGKIERSNLKENFLYNFKNS